MVLNAWWAAVGRHTLQPPFKPVGRALSSLSHYQKVLLGAVTIWGARLAARIVTRSIGRKGGDDPRYSQKKQEPGFWNKSALVIFGMEAVFQAVIALPFTIPFREDHVSGLTGAIGEMAGYARRVAAFLLAAGITVESLTDLQLESRTKQHMREGSENTALYTGGVWSIVRHPNYLGDALCHFAFPLWTYGSRLFGPAANLLFLRYVGGDEENEASQLERYSTEYRKKYHQMEMWQREKNSLWSGVKELANPWLLIAAAVGVLGAAVQAYAEGSRLGAAKGLAEEANAAYVAYA